MAADPALAFFKHNHENERAPRKVTRSSCVFYFVNSASVRTQIHFMNYWAVKRSVSDVTLRTTLRTMKGDQILQQEKPITATGGHCIEVGDLLNGKRCEGSIELEFLSDDNLVVAYPAALVRYVGSDWHTVAHSSQRYFSETSGDEPEIISALQRAEEGNITISENSSPFFIIHGGSKAIDDSDIGVRITAHDGKTATASIPSVEWRPYETKIIHLKDVFDYPGLLRGERGTATLTFNISGIFPRVIAGNDYDGRWSIDHSNFAAVSGAAAGDTFPASYTDGFKNLIFTFPNNFAENWKCWADIYPTYPGDKYDLVLREIKDTGDVVSVRQRQARRETPDIFPRIELPTRDEPVNFELSFEGNKDLPRRFHMGIHYQVGNGNPGFLTDGPIPYTTPPIRTRWLPIFDPDDCRNFIMIANRNAGNDPAEAVTFSLKLFNSFGHEPQRGTVTIPKYGSECFSPADMFPDSAKFLNGAPGWLYMVADRPQRCVIHYASVFGADSIAVCHAF